MKGKKLLAGVLSAAMAFSTMIMPVFANEENGVDSSAAFWEKMEAGTSIMTFENDITVVGKSSYNGTPQFNSDCVIDLAGNELTSNVPYIGVTNGANVKFTSSKPGAEINFDKIGGEFFRVSNGTISFENITFNKSGNEDANYVVNGESNDAKTFINFDNCILNCNGVNYVICGNNGSIKPVVNINNTTITTDNAAFLGGTYVLSGKSEIKGDVKVPKEVWVIGDDVKIDYSAAKKVVATVTAKDGSVSYYSNLGDALDKASSTDTITLLSNTTVTYDVIQKGNDITGGVNLDLNGYTLTIDVSNRNDQTVWFDNNWNITGDADKKSKIDFVANDEIDTGETFFAIGYFTKKAYNVKMSDLQLVLPSKMKKVYCGLIGVYDGGTLEMSNVDISSDDKTKETNALFYSANIGVENSVILKDVKVRDIKLKKIASMLKNIDIDNLDFEAEVTEYLFSGAGSVKNSKVKYTNTDFSNSEFLVRALDGKLTFVNTSFENVPTKFSKGQTILDGGQLYMDEKSAAAFSVEALKNVTPVKGSYKNKNGNIVDGTKATVSENGAGGSINVTLDELYANDGIDNTEDAKYQVVVTNCNAEDQAAVDALVKANEGKDVLAYDIKVTKTVGDTTTTVDGIKQQKVTLTLSDPVSASEQSGVKIYHIYKDENGVVKTEEITPVTFVNDTTITFTAPSFSTYAIVRNKVSVGAGEIATNVKAELVVNPDDPAEYNIVISAKDADKMINRLSVVDLTFELNQGTKGVVAYDVQAAGNMRLVKNGNDRYAFHFNGTNAADFSGKIITIGKVVFSGYCQGAMFGVKDLNTTTATVEDTNVVQAAEVNDSIVKTYKGANFDISGAKVDNLTLVEETKNLTVNVTFPNSIENQKADYQKMTVTIVSSDDSYEFNLGGAADTDAKVIKPDANGNYKIIQPVVKNRSYTVTVSGDGYRTARYTVNMTGAKVVNFWNNVKDTPDFVENGMDASKEQVTFLAGELVKDGKINIYDLSAVVSYFGTNNLVEDHPDYARYDLDRNGKIDSRDIAFVLVSWGK